MGFLATLLLALSAESGDLVVKYGAQIPQKNEGIGASKALFLAYQAPITSQFIYQYEGGFWADNGGNGRKSGGLTGLSGGVNVSAGYVFLQALTGPAYLTTTDSILGGHLQFNNDLAIGVRDPKTRNSIGVAYKHISSAGLSEPNRGRDFIMFRVSVGF